MRGRLLSTYVLLLSLTFLSYKAYSAQTVKLSLLNQSVMKSSIQSEQDLKRVFGLSSQNSLKVIKQRRDHTGLEHVRYAQTFQGLPVWSHQVLVSLKDGQIKGLHGTLVKEIDVDLQDVKPIFNKAAALKIVKEHFTANALVKNIWKYENIKTDLNVFVNNEKAILVYVVSFFADIENGGTPKRPTYIIDAKTKEVIKYYDALTTSEGRGPGGNTKTGKYKYGVDFPGFEVTENSDKTCSFQTPNVITMDLKNLTSTVGIGAFKYACGENTSRTINGAFSPVNDAHYFGTAIFGLYKDWYNTAPLQFPLKMRVHYSKNYENAFWDGKSMTFGDGYQTFYPLVSLDVSSHEIAHGFTEFNSGLEYEGQSGGINEAFSDMAGEAAEFYVRGHNDFLIGAEIFKKATGALRYMDDPTKDTKSIGNAKDYTETLDVHYSSGVYNKAFYLLATTQGWNTKKAFDVFVKANQDYWTPTTDFVTGAIGVRDAAKDLGYSIKDVSVAFSGVGVEIPN